MRVMIALTITLVICLSSANGILLSGPCTQELARVEAKIAASPYPIMGLEKPRCHLVTGEFLGMQVLGSKAHCVTEDGTKIPRYMVDRWATGDMDCQCARDEFDYVKTGMIGKMFSCEDNGNYARTGCTGSVCYCQDRFGDQVGTTKVHIADIRSLNC